MTPEQERDKEVTDAIVEVIGAFKGALRGFGHLPKDPSMRQKVPSKVVKQMPPSKN